MIDVLLVGLDVMLVLRLRLYQPSRLAYIHLGHKASYRKQPPAACFILDLLFYPLNIHNHLLWVW